jgi:hypothetical protein
MPELSNLLRQKLGEAQNGNGNHPDADTLTALTEQLLPASERQQVLAHLSACGQCREVFALSQPQLSESATQPVIKPLPVSRWRKLFTPTFGLAATAAAAAIIAVVMLVPQKQTRQSQPTPEAKVTQPAAVQPNVATEPQANVSTPAQPEVDDAVADKATASDQKKENGNESRSLRAAAAPSAKSAPAGLAAASNKDVIARQPAAVANKSAGPASASVLTAGLKKRDFVNTGIIFAANNTDNSSNAFTYDGLPAAPAPQISASEATFVAGNQGKITIFQDIPTNLASNQANLRVMTPPPAPEHFTCPMCKAVEKKARNVWHRIPGTTPAINTNALTLSAMGGQGKFSSQLQKEQPAEMAAAPEKPANVEGLQRFEGLSGRSMANAYTDSITPLWKVLGGKLVKSSGLGQWQDAYPGASFQFSIVNARGNEIWAGGTNASVIHSRDGGATWEVPRLGDSASGSVLSILVSGNTIQIKTSDNQSWSSSDGGKTWASSQ